MKLFFGKLAVVFKRDLLVALRLRGGLASLVTLLFDVAGLYYLTRSIGPLYRPEGIDYFAFATIGTAYVTFLLAGMSAFVHVIQEFQGSGVLEVLLSSRTPPVTVITLNATPPLFRLGLTLLITFLAAYSVISGTPLPFDPLSSIVVFLLSVVIIAIFGIMAAAVQLVTRKGQTVLWLAGSAAWFLGGTMYPVGALPERLQTLAHLLPVTYAVDAFRAAIVKGATLYDLRIELLVLLSVIAVLGPASVVMFNTALRIARQRGLLSWY
jgi:ABC-2 type transport system permease protein